MSNIILIASEKFSYKLVIDNPFIFTTEFSFALKLLLKFTPFISQLNEMSYSYSCKSRRIYYILTYKISFSIEDLNVANDF